MKSPNLRLITDAQARRCSKGPTRPGSATRHQGDSALQQVTARGEVLVSAGAVNSPKPLQLSGIGAPGLLHSIGIAVNHALPAVGENLSDHYSPRIVVRAKNIQTINAMVTNIPLAGQLLRWAARKPSVLGLSAAIVYAFGKSEPSMRRPTTRSSSPRQATRKASSAASTTIRA
jgi:choline dehydrogenase